MSTSGGSTIDQPSHRSREHCCGGWGRKGNWGGFNIAAMVLGFIVFWPLGLFIMFWIMSGRSVKELPQGIRDLWARLTGHWNEDSGFNRGAGSDNTVFNDYQDAQHDRIREIKEEIKERTRRFGEFRADAKRRADEDEFNRFMNDTPENGGAR